jgi:hypothetical protein
MGRSGRSLLACRDHDDDSREAGPGRDRMYAEYYLGLLKVY